MYIKSINVNFDRNKRLWVIIMGGLAVAITLITSAFVIVNKDSKIGGTIDVENIDIFNIDSYVAEFEARIDSNKNINRYKMREWYLNNEQGERFKFQSINETEEKMEYILADNTLKIKSENQISKFELSDYMINKTNLLSFKTFVELYKDMQKELNENISKEENEYEISYIILLKDISQNSEIYTKYIDILKSGIGVTRMELVLDSKTGIPKRYIVFDKELKLYIEVTYDKFKVNEKIDEKLFAF